MGALTCGGRGFERRGPRPGENMRFRLYVIARSKGTAEIVQCVQQMLSGAYGDQQTLEVIDVLENQALAEQDKVFVTPLLCRLTPHPQRKVVGDFSDPKALLEALNGNPLQPV